MYPVLNSVETQKSKTSKSNVIGCSMDSLNVLLNLIVKLYVFCTLHFDKNYVMLTNKIHFLN